MYLSKALSIVSFIAAFVIGIAAAYVVAGPGPLIEVAPVVNTSTGNACHRRAFRNAPVHATDLIGRWTGTFGYDSATASIEIVRVRGDKFYGTLRKEGAEIALEGTINSDYRGISFRETRVVRLGPDMSMWSLGTDEGSFSSDGGYLSGTGTDQWGTYGWAMEKVR